MPEFNIDSALMSEAWPPPYKTCAVCGGGRFRFEPGVQREDWNGGFSLWVMCLDCEDCGEDVEVVEKSYRRRDRIIFCADHRAVPGYAESPKCPSCGSDSLLGGHSADARLDWDQAPEEGLPSVAYAATTCCECGAMWEEAYA